MQLDITPETERVIQEELDKGQFQSVEALIVAGVQALREQSQSRDRAAPSSKGKEKAREFVKWAKNHPPAQPLSDQAMSRASLNPDRW